MLRSHLPPGYDGGSYLSPGPTAGTSTWTGGPRSKGAVAGLEKAFSAHTLPQLLDTAPCCILCPSVYLC